eukprot:CAMPEP_0118923460 /NCGR_PEP_ID=MMETSP1169-20130426/1973_1 /TAXON_ID=36882 /ORGANISM="Pyramimonas obovata, Strain CCMP722" /LENGTH=59 /DNA_ID=CAMNT_0006864445 /DNA_START=4945 /DNA_END=5124 /DNA_ORIENTATION=-
MSAITPLEDGAATSFNKTVARIGRPVHPELEECFGPEVSNFIKMIVKETVCPFVFVLFA